MSSTWLITFLNVYMSCRRSRLVTLHYWNRARWSPVMESSFLAITSSATNLNQWLPTARRMPSKGHHSTFLALKNTQNAVHLGDDGAIGRQPKCTWSITSGLFHQQQQSNRGCMNWSLTICCQKFCSGTKSLNRVRI